ncbi:guanylate kinase [Thermosulfurimonas dismutans]|uniref:Guanylate kinase n=1 Tax=Thermosulfurimonas dismutans TaxID=999894 RepID=A0A179D2U3_9BACT|nr:guanylate kinase [Thermosulfurimonas dismutans]OAQ20385.1 Guanylate kinase [Thermosulfurimonas dismutans]
MLQAGLLLVISAPSGAGKTTLCRLLIERAGFSFSVSHTTRSPRSGEVEGRDYYFVDRKTFEEMIRKGEFLEWAEVHGNLYGTSWEEVNRRLSSGQDLLLDIDVQGASQVRKRLGSRAIFVFIMPPSLEELERRLRGRGTEDEITVARRLARAREEMNYASWFDYVVVNDEVERAFEDLLAIVRAERCRPFRIGY